MTLYVQEIDRLIGSLRKEGPEIVFAICGNPPSASLHQANKASRKGFLVLSGGDLPKDRLDDAMRYAEQAIARSYGNANAHYIKGCVLFRKSRIVTAIESVKTALRLNPGHLSAKELLNQIHDLVGFCPGQTSVEIASAEPDIHRPCAVISSTSLRASG